MKKILFILTLILILPFSKVQAKETSVTLFWGDGCPHCAEEEKYLDILKQELGDNLNITKYEVWNNKENNELLTKVRNVLNDDNEGVPFLVIGNKYFTGYTEDMAKEIKKAIFDNLKQNHLNIVDLVKKGEEIPTSMTLNENPTIHFSLLGNVDAKEVNTTSLALTEGMSDAINLGSLWIMLFLFGILLSVYNKKKRFILGSIFVLTSTLTYAIFGLSGAEFTINQTAFIRSFISIIAIVIAGVSIDAHMKINVPKKSFLQKLQELFGKKQMIIYVISIIITSVIVTFALVNQANSSPALFKTVLEIQNVVGIGYTLNMILYYLLYLITSLILFMVINVIVKEIFIENTIGTYNRLIAGIVMLVVAALILFIPNMHGLFSIGPITLTQFFIVVGLSLATFVIVQITKVIQYRG